MLCFQGVDALGELLPIILILLGKPRRPAGAHQGNDGKNDEKDQEAQPDHCAEKFQCAFHKYDSQLIAAYPSTETGNKQCA
jgi:hypothetical protein